MTAKRNFNGTLTALMLGITTLSLMGVVGCSTIRPASDQTADAVISSKVKAKLAADPEVNPFDIDVDTQDGVVYLSGSVSSQAAMDEAEDLAEDTAGVRDVVNQMDVGEMTVKRTAKDALLVSRINAKLLADPQVSALAIDVDVDRGAVTLKGVVRTDAESEEAERLAGQTSGVSEVRNLIKVEAQ